jgi:AraC-like DNA-binding protein
METVVTPASRGGLPIGLRVRSGQIEAAWLGDAQVQAEAVDAGPVLMVDVRSGAAQGEVLAGTHGGTPFQGVTLVFEGRLTIGAGGRSLGLGAGRVLLWSSAHSGAFEASEGLRILHLLVPQSLCRQRWPALITGHLPDVRSCSAWVLAMAEAGSRVLCDPRALSTPEEREAGATTLLDLLAHPALPAAGGPDLEPRRIDRVIAYVDSHLADPGLGPQRLAQAFAMPIRTLHALLARHGLSVNGLIRMRRLERCRMALTSGPEEQPVGEIGALNGLPDPAHFSRLFKRTFGVGPREYRLRARRGEPGAGMKQGNT